MKVLLHVCCGPCAIYPLELLKKLGHQVFGFFYNPNIYPQEEFLKRRQAAGQFSQASGLELSFCPYQSSDFDEATKGWDDKRQRCNSCWQLRLNKTAEFARKNNFDVFTTTLLVSPYQDHGSLKNIGLKVQENKKVDFLYLDFREGFKQAQDKARQTNLYRQKHCGCAHSMEEASL